MVMMIALIMIALAEASVDSDGDGTTYEDNLRYFTPVTQSHSSGEGGSFSPDDRYIVYGPMQVRDAVSGEQLEVGPISGHPLWSPDGSRLCVMSDTNLAFWNVTTWEFEEAVDFSPKGDYYYHEWRNESIFCINSGGMAWVIDVSNGTQTGSKIFSPYHYSYSMSPNGSVIAVFDYDQMHLVAFPSGNLLRSFNTSTGAFRYLDWSDDGQVVFGRGQDGIEYWNLTTGENRYRSIETTAGVVDRVEKLFFIGDINGTVSVFSLPDLVEEGRWETGFDMVRTITMSHNRSLLSITGNGTMVVHTSSREPLWHVDGFSTWSGYGLVDDLHLRNGKQGFEMWNLSSMEVLWRFDSMGGELYGESGSISPDGKYCAIVYNSRWLDTTMVIYETRTRRLIGSMGGSDHPFEFDCIAWHPTKNLLATNGDDEILIYDIDNRRRLDPVELESFSYYVAWSPDGKMLCFNNGSKLVAMTYPGREMTTTPIDAEVRHVAFSPDGRLMMYHSQGTYPRYEEMTIVVETDGWQNVTDFGPGYGDVASITWGPENLTVVLGMDDRSVIVSTRTWECLAVIPYTSSAMVFEDDELILTMYGSSIYRIPMPFVSGELKAPKYVNEDVQVKLELVNVRSFYRTNVTWDLGYGPFTSDESVLVTWDDPGTYEISVRLTNAMGFRVDLNWTVLVIDVTPPTAVITGPSTVNEDTPITFSASGSSDNVGIHRYLWTTSDGGVSDHVDLEHKFAEPGQHLVTLVVWDREGLDDMQILWVNVSDVTPPFVYLICPDWLEVGGTLATSAASSWDNVGIDSYVWSIDGGFVSEGVDMSLMMDLPGKFNVSVNITDASGNWAIGWKEVAVGDITPPSLKYVILGAMQEDTEITFDASTSSDDGGGPISFTWSMPNGTDLHGGVVRVTFDDPGTYEVVLTVEDGFGNINTTVIELTLDDITPPIARISGIGQSVDEDVEVHIDGSMSSDNVGVASWSWTIATLDVTSDEVNLTHTFAEPGVYSVSLTVYDEAGLSNTTVIDVMVVDVTRPFFRVEPEGDVTKNISSGKKAEVPFEVVDSFDNVGVSRIEWDLDGDGVLDGTGEDVRLTLGPGSYVLQVTAYDEAGNHVTESIRIEIIEVDDEGSDLIWLVLPVAVVMAIIAAMVLLRRRPADEDR